MKKLQRRGGPGGRPPVVQPTSLWQPHALGHSLGWFKRPLHEGPKATPRNRGHPFRVEGEDGTSQSACTSGTPDGGQPANRPAVRGLAATTRSRPACLAL